MAPGVTSTLTIVKQVTCILGGVLLVFDQDNPLTDYCDKKTASKTTLGVAGTKTKTLKNASSTFTVGASTSVVVDGTTYTVSTTSTSVPTLTTSKSTKVKSSSTSTSSSSSSSTSTSSSSSSSKTKATKTKKTSSTSTSSSSSTLSVIAPTTTSSSTSTPTSSDVTSRTTSDVFTTLSSTSTTDLSTLTSSLSTTSDISTSTMTTESTSTLPTSTTTDRSSTVTTSTDSAISITADPTSTDSTTSSTADPTTSTSTTVISSSSSTSSSAPAPTSTQYDAFMCPNDLPLSCMNTTVIENTCCFESPGGLVLQTQFWDTNPATGPNNSWTIHGLWPDNCDGTYQQYCDPAREYTNITQILQANGDQALLDYMNTYWTSNSGTAESFWEHEWGKHGTCMSTFDPECYPDYNSNEEVDDFFHKTVEIYQTNPTYDLLAAAGIYPSTTQQYTLAQFQAALSPNHGNHSVYLGCSGGQVDEVWWYYYVRGSLQTGQYVPTDIVGTQGCPATFNYYPKGYIPPKTSTSQTSIATTATGTGTATSPSTTSTGLPFTGSGYIYVYNSAGTQQGFLISAGTWYTAGGTPATYTTNYTTNATTGLGPFTLHTSKGYCEVYAGNNTLGCGPWITVDVATGFFADGSTLVYGAGNGGFGAAAVPTGTAQGNVVAGVAEPYMLTLTWVGK